MLSLQRHHKVTSFFDLLKELVKLRHLRKNDERHPAAYLTKNV